MASRFFFGDDWSSDVDCVYHAVAHCLGYANKEDLMHHLGGHFDGDLEMAPINSETHGLAMAAIEELLEKTGAEYKVYTKDDVVPGIENDFFSGDIADVSNDVFDKLEWDGGNIPKWIATGYTRTDGSGHCVNYELGEYLVGQPEAGFKDHQDPHLEWDEVWGDIKRSKVKFIVLTVKYAAIWRHGFGKYFGG